MVQKFLFIISGVVFLLNFSACAIVDNSNSISVDSQTPSLKAKIIQEKAHNFKKWHEVSLDFEGPNTSETAESNPFTDYRLLVEFKYIGDSSTASSFQSKAIRGFYAADGNAAQTSADSGNIWQVRFSPDQEGLWSYSARLDKGKNIALSSDLNVGERISISNAKGSFRVEASDKVSPDFRATKRGRLIKFGRYFRFASSGDYWLKGGPNSPENLLAFEDFDATYRIKAEARVGEATSTANIHSFAPHLNDWRKGDPSWGNASDKPARGKALIGAMNYLAEQGMNTVYFLTLNILGDGKDVWPYQHPEDFSRFDVSKLEQWNLLFNHMQSKGILLHIVIQETENELMLDGGDTGPQRSLYFAELISRFAHHPAIVWNLGEENGPVEWRPEGQNDAQRIAMTQFFEKNDPYGHPVLLHTHSEPHQKDHILKPLLGFTPLDGLSFQVDQRREVNAETQKWLKLAKESGNEWLITMDEIGVWHTGARPDAMAGGHDSLRRHALWGHLLAGGAGVEWYFGARYPGNDLGSEDWRTRHNLWKQTNNALRFFNDYLPYWEMSACGEQDISNDRADVYCMTKPEEIYAIYFIEGGNARLTLPGIGNYDLSWFDPRAGGALQKGSVVSIPGGEATEIGLSPTPDGRDWVLLLQKK